MVTPHDTRLDPPEEDDLRWLFCHAGGELGQRSPMGPMIDRLNEGRTHATSIDADAEDRRVTSQMLAVARVRRIEGRLRRINERHEVTLRAAYGPGPTPGERAGLEGLHRSDVPLALLRLTALRTGVPIEKLRARATPPPEVRAPARPDATGTRTSDAKDDPDARRAQASAARKRLADWQTHRDESLRPLRDAAREALDEACAAYRATRTETP